MVRSASRITRLPYVQERLFGAIAMWVFLPIALGFGLAGTTEWAQELASFRHGGQSEEISVLTKDKHRSSGRGKVRPSVEVQSPYNGQTVSISVDQGIFDVVQPNRGCVSVMIQTAPNGVVRVVRPLAWTAACPWSRNQGA